MSTNAELPEEAFMMALLSLPAMGPKRLDQILANTTARDTWARLTAGAKIPVEGLSSERKSEWRAVAARIDVEQYWLASKELGMWTQLRSSERYPTRLQNDIEPPHMIFGLGDEVPSTPTVAIIGTRSCTSYGKRCAFEFGAALASAGVSVVSGLALGIDAAAHEGALSVEGVGGAAPVAVVGSGLDIIYPRRNASLWRRVAERGTVLSETAPGVGPQKWRFPARNRIIAALADAVIVIESHESGGSLLTVDSAQDRDVPVGVVPGPINSNSSSGSNRLLIDGATPVLSVDDILMMIGHQPPVEVKGGAETQSSALLDALGWNPLLFEELCGRVTLAPSETALEIERLIAEGLCARNGPWIERIG